MWGRPRRLAIDQIKWLVQSGVQRTLRTAHREVAGGGSDRALGPWGHSCDVKKEKRTLAIWLDQPHIGTITDQRTHPGVGG